MANLITRLITAINGQYVGEDDYGNRYYHQRKTPAGMRRRRWVVYSGKIVEASKVPPLFHSWLHYTSDSFPNKGASKPLWMKAHQPNITGSPMAYRPPGHPLNPRSGNQKPQRDKATGDYQAWVPDA